MLAAARKEDLKYIPTVRKKRSAKGQGIEKKYKNIHIVDERRRPDAALLAKRKKEGKAKRKQKKSVFSTFMIIFIAFGTLSLLVARYSIISANNSDIKAKEANIGQLSDRLEELNLDIVLQDDLEYVQEVASSELNMGFPGEDQIVYIDLDEASFGSDTSGESGTGEDTITVLDEVVSWLE